MKVGKRAAEYGITATIRHYEIKYPDLVLKESSVHRFKNTYQDRIKLNLNCLGAAGLETPGFARVAQQEDRTSASYWRRNRSANTALFNRSERLYCDYS